MRSVLAHEAAVERFGAGADDAISWVERSDADGRYAVNCAPHEVAGFLARAALRANAQRGADQRDAGYGSFLRVFAPDAGRRRCARADRAVALRLRSAGASLHRARRALNPKSTHFARRAAPLVEECLDRTRGRAFVLFTSYARLREVHALLCDRLSFPMRMQGDLPRSHLLDWFRRTPGAVLFATSTFWEGIDVVGDALSCVIIDRLPFPSPADPLVDGARARARSARP